MISAAQSRTFLLAYAIALALSLTVCIDDLSARDIYVDNRAGNNLANGFSQETNDPNEGPVRTIRRALVLARQGDVIVLKNNGFPYYESISLAGVNHCGSPMLPFSIQGNGAVISGLMLLPPEAWFPVGNDLWMIKPARKGFYQLVRGEIPVPEFRIPEGTSALPEIPVGHWAAWKGTIYFRGEPNEDVSAQPFALARDDMGISLHRVRHVRIENLTIRHFRIDGVNAHDGCRNIQLVNVISQENGRSGLVSAGTSDVSLLQCQLVGNRIHSLLVTERAAAFLEETELSTPATMLEE